MGNLITPPAPYSLINSKLNTLFYIPKDNQEQSALLQAAINKAVSAGYNALTILPANGPILLSRTNTIIIPKNFYLKGHPGAIFKGTGGIPNKATFPYVSGCMFGVGDPLTGQRYGKQIARFTSGSGATFNLTVTGGAVTSATIVNAGTGYKAGDSIYLPYGTVLGISTVASHRGPISAITISNAGSWGSNTPTNPVAQTGSIGNALYDRVLDQSTFADSATFDGIVMDGNISTQLTGLQYYGGIDIRGVIQANIFNCKAFNFPNTAFLTTDVKRGFICDNYAYECGWYGVFSTTRNGFSNTGLYLTNGTTTGGVVYTNNHLMNTDAWLFSRNQCYSIGDVGSQFSCITGVISNNIYRGCGTLSIEGEGASYNILDTYALNGGVKIPADVKLIGNDIDGTMLYGRLATNTTASANYVSAIALDGLSYHASNEGRIELINNTIKNTQRYGIYAAQNDNGSILYYSNTLINVANGTTTVRAQAVYLAAEIIDVQGKNIIKDCLGGPQLYIENRGLRISIEGLELINCGSGGGQPAVYINMFRSRTISYFKFKNNILDTFYWHGLWFVVTGSNTIKINVLDISDNTFIDGNMAHTTGVDYPYINLGTSGGGTLNLGLVKIERNVMYENALHTTSTAAPINIYGTSSTGATQLNIRDNTLPQFTTKYAVNQSVAPLATAYTNNQ